MYNVEKWIEDSLKIVLSQTYEDYQCVIIDDASTDQTAKKVEEFLSSLENNKSKFLFIQNKKNCGALHNIYEGIKASSPSDQDVIVTLDGDDWLAHPMVLQKICSVYEERGCLLTHGNFTRYPEGHSGFTAFPSHVVENNLYRQFRWNASHLRSFKYKLWKNIKKEDLIDYSGEFYRMAWDVAMMTPMLEMCAGRLEFIKDVLYVYNRSNPLNDDKMNRAEQIRIEKEIRQKSQYRRLV